MLTPEQILQVMSSLFTEQQIRQMIREEVGQLFGSDRYTVKKLLQITDGINIQLGLTTGTKFGTSTSQKIGFFNKTPVVQQTVTDFVNNISVSGTTDQLDNYINLSTYSSDASFIKNNLYQIAIKVQAIVTALRTYGLNL